MTERDVTYTVRFLAHFRFGEPRVSLFYVNKTVDVRKNITLENAKIGYQENSQALLE